MGRLDTGNDAAGALRRAQRQERQARVGILRNPNRVPNPPPHRPPLMGKWLPLRSSRRPPERAEEEEAPPPAPEAEADAASVLADADGAIRGIDLDRLMNSIEGLGHKRTSRAGLADHILLGQQPPRPPEDARLAEALRTPPPEAEAEPPPPPGRLRGVLARLLGAWA